MNRPAPRLAVLLLALAACGASTTARGGPPAEARKIHAFPTLPESCENPHTCGFACGPCAQCQDEGPEVRQRQQGFGLIELQLRDQVTGAPIPNAGVTLLLHEPAPIPGGVRPRRTGLPTGAPASHHFTADHAGKVRAVLRTGRWTAKVALGELYPPADHALEVSQCLSTVVLRVRPLSREDVEPKLLEGVSCDRRQLTCRQAGLTCPPGFVAQIEGGCFGVCVPLEVCVCSTDADCPEGRCGRGRCSPHPR